MPKYDARCNECNNTFEEERHSEGAVSACPNCGGTARTVWLKISLIDKAKDPYDYLDKRPPDSKPIKSYASDHRHGGKNTK